jgi:hypothetical protein
MREILQNEKPPEKEKPSRLAILLRVLVLAVVGFSFWRLFDARDGQSSGSRQTNLPAKMNPAEAAYRGNIRIENIALSRAENFIHQEVTILDADTLNSGQQSIASFTVTVEFFDDLHQVVLRETRGILGTSQAPLAPGQRRSFSISFDRVPASWNRQAPSVQVTYLQLAAGK